MRRKKSGRNQSLFVSGSEQGAPREEANQQTKREKKEFTQLLILVMKSHDREIIDAHMRNAHCAHMYTGEWDPLELISNINPYQCTESHARTHTQARAFNANDVISCCAPSFYLKFRMPCNCGKQKCSIEAHKRRKIWRPMVLIMFFAACTHPQLAALLVRSSCCTTNQRSIVSALVQKQNSINCLATFGRSAVGSTVSLLRFTQIECVCLGNPIFLHSCGLGAHKNEAIHAFTYYASL